MSLTRTQILKGNYLYPNELVHLKPKRHFIERLEQRSIGLNCIPTMVRITKDNIYCGEADGKYLTTVVVRLDFNYSKYVFICFNPYSGSLITFWFRDKKRNKDANTRRESSN